MVSLVLSSLACALHAPSGQRDGREGGDGAWRVTPPVRNSCAVQRPV